MTEETIADRLRLHQKGASLTAAEMAEMTGIPKRTLEKYMLRTGAAQPGLEALKRLSAGLGLSLDWLIYGNNAYPVDIARITRLSCRAAVLQILTELKATGQELQIEELALEIAADAGDRAKSLAEIGSPRRSLEIAEETVNRQQNLLTTTSTAL